MSAENSVFGIIENFVEDRPTMKANNSDPGRMAELLTGEVNEALEVLDNPKELGKELADVLWFVVTMAHLKGIDIEKEVRDKAAYNSIRYPAGEFQRGDYQETYTRLKSESKYWEGVFYLD